MISGCAHAGVITIAAYAKELAETESFHAVLGGFHLTGPAFEDVVGPTIEALRKMDTRFVVPMHCTGWRATARFAEEMPGPFVLNTVGTTCAF